MGFTVWQMDTLKFIKCDNTFLEVTKFSLQHLENGFRLPDLFPKFFQPFVFDGPNQMQSNFAENKESHVAQMGVLQTADGNHVPVHLLYQTLRDPQDCFALHIQKISAQ